MSRPATSTNLPPRHDRSRRFEKPRSTSLGSCTRWLLIAALACAASAAAQASNRTLQNDSWVQLVVPADAGSRSVAELFGDDLDPGDYGNTWSLYVFDVAAQDYRDPGLQGTLAPATAFWMIQRTGADVQLDLPANLPAVSTQPSSACPSEAGCFATPLATRAAGNAFTMRGSPFDRPSAVASFTVQNRLSNDVCEDGCSLAKLAAARELSPALFVYDATRSAYRALVEGNSLQPWEGFWIATSPALYGRQPQLLFPADDTTTAPAPAPEPEENHDGGALVVWANDGGDKVLRDELRASEGGGAVNNAIWNDRQVSLNGARNEVVAFNAIIEAPGAALEDVNVSLDSLNGPGGATIASRAAEGNGVFNSVGRNVELFYVRYLTIRGLSRSPYNSYDERHVPAVCRRPFNVVDSVNGRDRGVARSGSGWSDRPCHDRDFPDIAVPLEFEQGFDIAANTNQSIWIDITIPRDATPGEYTGTLSVTSQGGGSQQVPVSLNVSDMQLPEVPSAKTMLHLSREDIAERYLGERRPRANTANYVKLQGLLDEHFKMAHRHGISLITGHKERQYLDDGWTDRLSGELFTAARGYSGRGEGVGNNVFSIGTYGSWPWSNGSEADMWSNTDAWIDWFDNQSFGTPTDTFLYLIDESDDTAEIERWSSWADSNAGQGRRLSMLATLPLPEAVAGAPSLDIPASTLLVGEKASWQAAADRIGADPDRDMIMYNGGRPASGTFAIEDDGIALRMLPWVQYKHGVDRWFYWNSTYYTNDRCAGGGKTNVFQQAQTFGCNDRNDPVLGRTGRNYMNGDGVMFYPGTDRTFTRDSYGVNGPLASLRMKQWRRGLQDYEYLRQAQQADASATQAIVRRMVPTTLWEHGVNDSSDPTYVHADISWPTASDDWVQARRDLAAIIGR